MPNLATNHIVRVAPIVKALERHHDVKLIGVLKEGEELFPPFAKEFAYTVVRWTGRGGFLATLRILPSAIDFLFLDGDHSYEGVRRDFENYAPLVRPGGIVALQRHRGGQRSPLRRHHRRLGGGCAALLERAEAGPRACRVRTRSRAGRVRHRGGVRPMKHRVAVGP